MVMDGVFVALRCVMEAAVSQTEVSWRSYIFVSHRRGHGGRSIRVSWKPKFPIQGAKEVTVAYSQVS